MDALNSSVEEVKKYNYLYVPNSVLLLSGSIIIPQSGLSC
nr:MAG TPA: hypothetical protein [Caudoviricetes sp.]